MLAITIVICIFLFLMAALILGHIEKKHGDNKLTYEILGQINDELLDLSWRVAKLEKEEHKM